MRSIWMLVLALACTDGDSSSDDSSEAAIACVSGTECPGDLACFGPNEPTACGVPPREQCSSNTDCGGDACSAIPDACSPDGVGSECRSACGTCDAGFTCTDGACVATSCEVDPTVCAAHEICLPNSIVTTGPVHERHHGCSVLACGGDGDCTAAAASCVNGYCQTGPGECREVVAVP